MKPWREREKWVKVFRNVWKFFGFLFTFSAIFLPVCEQLFPLSYLTYLKYLPTFRFNFLYWKQSKNLGWIKKRKKPFDERTIYKNNAFYFLHLSSKKKVSLIIQQNKLSYNQYEALNFPTALFHAKLEWFDVKSDGKQGK